MSFKVRRNSKENLAALKEENRSFEKVKRRKMKKIDWGIKNQKWIEEKRETQYWRKEKEGSYRIWWTKFEN